MSLDEQLAQLILRSLDRKQHLLLKELGTGKTLSSLADAVSRSQAIPLSTVKRDMAKLRQMGIFDFRKGGPVELTELGRLLLNAMGEEHGD